MNYIKRLIGLPGETIAIRLGKVYYLAPDKGLSYDDVKEAEGDPNKLLQLWRPPYTHHNDKEALDRFTSGQFEEIIRKPPAVLLAMMRLVYDNDHPATDLGGLRNTSRLGACAGQRLDQQRQARLRPRRLRRQHRLAALSARPPRQPGQTAADHRLHGLQHLGLSQRALTQAPGENWASDLIAECDVEVESAQGNFVLELSKGPDRFQGALRRGHGHLHAGPAY